MTTLFVNYKKDYVSGGAICEGQENDPYPQFEDTYYSFSVESITLKNVTPYHEEIEYAGPIESALWVVVVRYSDGGTFGLSCGYGSIEGVYATQEEAEVRRKELREGGKSITGFNVWDGFFARLQDVEIHLVVRE